MHGIHKREIAELCLKASRLSLVVEMTGIEPVSENLSA